MMKEQDLWQPEEPFWTSDANFYEHSLAGDTLLVLPAPAIDDELLFMGPDGGIFTKSDDLELHRSGVQRLTHAEWREVLVQVHGTTAISVVTAFLSGTFRGEQFSGLYRYSRTWAHGSDGWLIVGGSVSAIAPAPF